METDLEMGVPALDDIFDHAIEADGLVADAVMSGITESVDWRLSDVGQLMALLEGAHTYCTTQFDFPSHIATKIKEFGLKIPDSCLAEDGRETKIHVTALYGLHGDGDSEALPKLVGCFGPVKVKLGPLSCFCATADKPHDVLKVEIDSPDLVKLHDLLKTRPNSDKWPTYNPHVTVAFLKPGEGKKYDGKKTFEGLEWTFDALTFRDRDGKPTKISLVKDTPEAILRRITENVLNKPLTVAEILEAGLRGQVDLLEAPPRTNADEPHKDGDEWETATGQHWKRENGKSHRVAKPDEQDSLTMGARGAHKAERTEMGRPGHVIGDKNKVDDDGNQKDARGADPVIYEPETSLKTGEPGPWTVTRHGKVMKFYPKDWDNTEKRAQLQKMGIDEYMIDRMNKYQHVRATAAEEPKSVVPSNAAGQMSPHELAQKITKGEIDPVARHTELEDPATAAATRKFRQEMRDDAELNAHIMSGQEKRRKGEPLTPEETETLNVYNAGISREAAERAPLELNKLSPAARAQVQNLTFETVQAIQKDAESAEAAKQGFFPDVWSFVQNTLGIAYSKAEQWNQEFQKQRGLPPDQAKRISHGLAIADYAIGGSIATHGKLTGSSGLANTGIKAAAFVPWATVSYMAAAPFMTAATQPGSFGDKLKAGLLSPMWVGKAAFNTVTQTLDKMGISAVTAPVHVIPRVERAVAVHQGTTPQELTPVERAAAVHAATRGKGAAIGRARAANAGGPRGRPSTLPAEHKDEIRLIQKRVDNRKRRMGVLQKQYAASSDDLTRRKLTAKITQVQTALDGLHKRDKQLRAATEAIENMDPSVAGLMALMEEAFPDQIAPPTEVAALGEEPQSESNLQTEDIDILQDALEEHEKNPDWYMVLALSAYGILGDMADAVEAANAVFLEHPDGPSQAEQAAARSTGVSEAVVVPKPQPATDMIDIKALLLEQERKFLEVQRQMSEAVSSRPLVIQMPRMKKTVVRDEKGMISHVIEEPA